MTYPQDAVYLNLYNFDLPQHEDSPYIITSLRSLKACHQLGIKPCELLYKSLDEYEQDLAHLPLRDVVYQYEQGERARQEKLSVCRELRLRQVCRELRRSGGGGRSGARRVVGVRPDLLPPTAPAMSADSRSATPRSAALSRTKSVSWAGLDQSGEYFTDIHGDDGDLSSEEDIREDVWSSEEEGGDVDKQEDTGRAPSPAREEDEDRDSVAEEASEGEDAGAEEDGDNAGGWVPQEEEGENGDISDEEAYDRGPDAPGEDGSASEEDYGEDTRRGGESEDDVDGEEYGAARYREESSQRAVAAGGHSEHEDGYDAAANAGEDAEEDEEEEPGWYPMEDSRAADLRLELRSSAGLSTVSVPPAGRRRRPAAVSFSARPPEAAPALRRAAPSARTTSATSRSRASRCSTQHSGDSRRRQGTAPVSAGNSSVVRTPAPSLLTVSVGDLPSLRHLADSGADLQVRPSDRRILELMTRRQEQGRQQERLAHQEQQRWRQEWLQQLRQEAEREDRRAETVLTRRRAEAWESQRRREELQQKHSQSLDNLTALIRGRDERTAHELASQRDRKREQLTERQRREQQQQLLTSQQREQLESEERQQRRQQQQRLQQRMHETERRRNDQETARTQHVSSLNASWLALSEERIQRLDEAAERRSRRVWEELGRRIQTATDNQRRLERSRRSQTAAISAADDERRRQARAARQRQLQLSAGHGREAAARLQRDQLRAERTARQLSESRQLAVSRENLARQTRHRQALQHIRHLEGQMLDEARFQLKLDEARVEQFVQRRELAAMSSRHLAHVAANLRQAVRSGERSATFDRMAARADLESRMLSGPAQTCDKLYRPRSQTHIV